MRGTRLAFLLGLCTAIPFAALLLAPPRSSSLLPFSVRLPESPLQSPQLSLGRTPSSCLPFSNPSTKRSSVSPTYGSQGAVLAQMSFG